MLVPFGLIWSSVVQYCLVVLEVQPWIRLYGGGDHMVFPAELVVVGDLRLAGICGLVMGTAMGCGC